MWSHDKAKRYVSTFTRLTATKLDRVVGFDEKILSIKSKNLSMRPVVTKLGRMVEYTKKPPTQSHMSLQSHQHVTSRRKWKMFYFRLREGKGSPPSIATWHIATWRIKSVIYILYVIYIYIYIYIYFHKSSGYQTCHDNGFWYAVINQNRKRHFD